MILQALNELYDRLDKDPRYEIAAPGFSLQKITFRIVLKPDGTLFEIQDARVLDESGRQRPRQMFVLGDTKASGAGLNPCFLWDTPGYLLGYKPDSPERALETFAASAALHHSMEGEVDSEHLRIVCRFFGNWNPADAERHPILEELASGYGVFQILGESRFVHENAEIKEWWTGRKTESTAVPGQCLVTGSHGSIAIIQKKIKGVSGGKSDMSLVGFNEKAYESYGKEQGQNAPVLEEVSFRYGTALNVLLDGPMRSKHRRRLSDATVVFWTQTATVLENVFAAFLMPDYSDQIKEQTQDQSLLQQMEALIDAVATGREAYSLIAEDPDRTRYFLLALSPNAARISVRFFLEGTVTSLLDNLRKHHTDMHMQPQWPSDSVFPSNTILLRQTARDVAEIPPLLSSALMRSVIQGTAYPTGMYQAVLRRIVADRVVNHPRACILKGYLVRNHRKELPMSLDSTREEASYRLGRLFAALEKTQGDALGTLNAGIRDKFYASASSTPAAVFPRLLRTYQHHLAKLEGGHKVNRERLVQEIVSPLTLFPSHFGMNDQGLFALGYYHQRQDFFTKKDNTQHEEN
jgi:CRISPR-associated protein Csd1